VVAKFCNVAPNIYGLSCHLLTTHVRRVTGVYYFVGMVNGWKQVSIRSSFGLHLFPLESTNSSTEISVSNTICTYPSKDAEANFSIESVFQHFDASSRYTKCVEN
jgi:hypothetical protein